ncbi:ABC transporter ATP-binding protein [Mucilaginibacter lacusdianchii]|uniref:ABC transporter ATP-binding protein n=1 Tax=Mucilaginibacter lacusdianchii TaxID=2684211 RepID=UPI00131E216A|nr:ABC transporter ATP-binding protein [Mucilaginibacter sp. JXJ CY 39]
MIQVRQLSKHYGATRAVDDISFEVSEHENLVLLGTSGCGKTTTLKMLNRLIEPTHGQVLIDGQDISQQKPELLRRNIGYVLQNNGLFPHYTVAENIATVPQLLNWDVGRITKRMHELLEKLHLPADLLKLYPQQLSGGQQQRVGLARALMADAPVLLMDEPFGALDTITRTKIQAEFKALDELQRKTIVMVTHDVQEAFELGNRIALMHQGRIVQIGTPAELLFNPASAFVKEFLQAQRLQLELKSVKLTDVWDNLPTPIVSGMQPVACNEQSVWWAMERFKEHAIQNIAVQHPQTHQVKTITFEQLMSAYYQYQNALQPHE